MRYAIHTKEFRRDYKKAQRSGKNIRKLDAIIDLIIDAKPLPVHCRDHQLRGELKYLRDCHIEGDWLLLYEIVQDDDGVERVIFHATDNHENLFG